MWTDLPPQAANRALAHIAAFRKFFERCPFGPPPCFSLLLWRKRQLLKLRDEGLADGAAAGIAGAARLTTLSTSDCYGSRAVAATATDLCSGRGTGTSSFRFRAIGVLVFQAQGPKIGSDCSWQEDRER